MEYGVPALHHVINLCACYDFTFLWSPDVYEKKEEIFPIITSLIILCLVLPQPSHFKISLSRSDLEYKTWRFYSSFDLAILVTICFALTVGTFARTGVLNHCLLIQVLFKRNNCRKHPACGWVRPAFCVVPCSRASWWAAAVAEEWLQNGSVAVTLLMFRKTDFSFCGDYQNTLKALSLTVMMQQTYFYTQGLGFFSLHF